MKNIHRAPALLLALLCLLSLLAPAALAAGEAGTVSLRTAEDLETLARNCSLDTWSQGKTVVLEQDIDLTGRAFTPIPTFGGTFLGQGHTISGVSLTGSGSTQGFFRYLQPGALVQDLNVAGALAPSGQRNTLGGLAGSNRGTLTGCSFSGTVQGGNQVGGVAGCNETEGQIINCSFSGSVTGEHAVGGIVGENRGSAVQCENSGCVNTTQTDPEVSRDSLNLEQLNAAENLPACTDIGGIAGLSTGILQSCRNRGDVGYAHVGYNVGGVAGRQSGYLDGCSNSGTIRGRKDVGGIAGQLEPEVVVRYDQGTLGRLVDQLDVLRGLMDQTSEHLRGSSDAVSAQLHTLSQQARTTQALAGELAGAAQDWADGTIGSVNDLTARIAWALDQTAPILDETADTLALLETLSQQLQEGIQALKETARLGEEAAGSLRDALSQVQTAGQKSREALERLSSALEHLKASLGKPQDSQAALQEAQTALQSLSQHTRQLASALGETGRILREGGQALQGTQEWEDLLSSLDALSAAGGQTADALLQVGSTLGPLVREGASAENLSALGTAAGQLAQAGGSLAAAGLEASAALVQLSLGDQEGALDRLYAGSAALALADVHMASARAALQSSLDAVLSAPAGGNLSDALDQLEAQLDRGEAALEEVQAAWEALKASPEGQQLQAELEAALPALRSALDQTRGDLQALRQAASKLLLPSLSQAELEAARDQVKAAGSSLSAAGDALDQAMDRGLDALGQLKKLFRQAGRDTALEEAGDTLEDFSRGLSGATRELYQVVRELAGQPVITLEPVSGALREKGDALDDALSGLLDQGEALGDILTQSADLLLDDWNAINDQLGVITGLLREELQEPRETALEDRFQDQSDQADLSQTSGRISGCRNTGAVEGDVNVAGVAGSMALEYDFDPEDDLVREGDRSLDFQYQTKAVVFSCVNQGTVTGKKDYAGGVVGRMDLGMVSGCGGYGPVESTGGSYVGGIAGASWGTIRDCWSKCSLAGGDYVGGVAGLGATVTGCHTLVTLDRGEACVGAIAGDTDPEGTVTGNTFTSDTLAALDGISYEGKAQPVSFDVLCATPGAPAEFTQLELTFTADGRTVAVLPFQYGGGVDTLPAIPPKAGYSAAWPELDYTHLTASQTVEAVYTPYASALTDGGQLPQILVDGSFGSRAQVSHTAREVSWTAQDGTVYTGTAYTVAVDDPDFPGAAYTVHFRLPDRGQRYLLWVQEGGTWNRRDFALDGQYLLLPVASGPVTFCLTPAPSSHWLWLIPLGVFLLALSVFLLRRRRKKRAAPPPEETAAPR